MLLENLLLASYGVHFTRLLFLWLYCGGFFPLTFQVESTIIEQFGVIMHEGEPDPCFMPPVQ